MSDALVAQLQSKIEALQTEVATLKGDKAALERRLANHKDGGRRITAEKEAAEKQRDELKEQVGALTKERDQAASERDQLRADLDAAPEEWKKRWEDAEARLLARDHRDAWKDALNGSLQDKASLEELWAKVQYKAEGRVDPSRINELVKGAREAAPYLFKAEGVTPSPPPPEPNPGAGTSPPTLQVGIPASRGGRETASGRLVVRRSDYSDPLWMRANQSRLVEAQRTGTLSVID